MAPSRFLAFPQGIQARRDDHDIDLGHDGLRETFLLERFARHGSVYRDSVVLREQHAACGRHPSLGGRGMVLIDHWQCPWTAIVVCRDVCQ